MASLSTTGELLSVMCPIAMVMADAWCWRRTAAPPLRGFRIVGRVSMKRLPQFEVRRWCIYRLMATEVGSPLWWILMDGSGFANVGSGPIGCQFFLRLKKSVCYLHGNQYKFCRLFLARPPMLTEQGLSIGLSLLVFVN